MTEHPGVCFAIHAAGAVSSLSRQGGIIRESASGGVPVKNCPRIKPRILKLRAAIRAFVKYSWMVAMLQDVDEGLY